jgi:WhiB family redox-sensing transcriptional regulator
MRSPDLLAITTAPAWMAEGLCAQVDPELFFPERGGSTREAKRVCRACPVQPECLAYALAHGERFGIWGATSERERRRLTGPAGPDAPGEVDAA